MADGTNGNGKNRFNPLVIFGGVGLTGLITIINLVASSGYVSKSEYEKHIQEFNQYKLNVQSEMAHTREDQIQKLGDIAGGIKELNSKMQDNIRQDLTLKDHEERVRELENRSRK